MSLVLLLIRLHSLVNSSGALPLTIIDESIADTSLTSISTRNVVQADINSKRSALDILWSCLATTFAVTWLSVHPNIPSLGEKVWWIIWRRFKLMFWALVAPEFVILWAWRQRRAAYRIAEEVRILAKKRNQTYGHDWTIVHGHFLQMGGFFIQSGKRSPRVLYFEQFKSMVGKTIDIPPISEDEISDRGKSDPLGKGIAALQIIWFIVQVIARRVNHLAITQLELTTAALGCLNATMYILWWSKPLDVRCPVTIQPYQVAGQPIQSPDPVIFRDSRSHQETLNKCESITLTRGNDKPTTVPSTTQITDNIYSPIKRQVSRITRGVISLILEPLLDIAHRVSANFKSAFAHGIISGLKNCLFIWLISPFIHLVVGIVIERHMTPGNRTPIFYVWPGDSNGGSQTSSETVIRSNSFRTQFAHLSSESVDVIPASIETLWHSQPSITVTTTWKELLMASLVGGLFGGTHILGWNLEFPSIAEREIWRVSACIITAIPCFYVLLRLLFDAKNWRSILFRFDLIVLYFILAISYCAAVARIILFINSLLALRALPSSAFATLNWLSIIPHI